MSIPEQESPKYAYSFDEERYDGNFDTREEAVEEARDIDPDIPVWTGRAVRPKLSHFLRDADWWLEWASDRAADECAEYSDGWPPKAPPGADDDLMRVLDEWAERHGLQPQFFLVEDVQEHGKVEAV